MIHNITTCTPCCTATSIITQMITRTVSFIRVDVVLNRLLVSLMGSLFCCTLKSDGCSKWRWTVQSSAECCNRDDTLWLMWVNQSWTQSDVHVDVDARLHPLVIVTTPWTKLREYLWLAYRLTLWCQTHLTEMKQCMNYKQLTMWPHQSQRRSTCSRSDGPHPSGNFDLWAQLHTCSSSN